MKKIFLLIMTSIVVSGAFSQVRHLNFSENVILPLDSDTEYKQVRDGVVMQGGQLKMVRNGNLYPLNRPITLKNGSIVINDGIIKLTNEATRPFSVFVCARESPNNFPDRFWTFNRIGNGQFMIIRKK